MNHELYAKNLKNRQHPIEKPKLHRPLSIPSEETRILIEERKTPQQKPKTQQKRTEEKPKPENFHGNNVEELLKKAQELETKGNKKEAFQLTKKAADKGHSEAKSKVGQWYLEQVLKYLGQQSILEKLERKITPPRKGNKTETLTAPKPHFRHQRNRITELNGCGDMAATETSVLHAEKAEEKTWVGEDNNKPPQPAVIIQEVVRYVTYWWGNDCLPGLIRVDRQETEVCECPLQSGHEFSVESIVWQEIPPSVAPEEASRPMEAEEEQNEQAPKPSFMDRFFRIFRNPFTIFKR